MRTSILAAIVCLCTACETEPPAVMADDAWHADASSAPEDAATADAGVDAGGSGCTIATTPWSLDAGTWSTDFAARGLSGHSTLAFDTVWLDDELFVSGYFTHAGPVPARNVAAWSRARGWRALGDGLADLAMGITVAADGRVYASTQGRTVTGTMDLYFVHAFTDGAWTPIGQADGPVSDLGIDLDGALVVIGQFTSIGEIAASGLARWDGSAWSAVAHPGTRVHRILADDLGLCIGAADDLGAFVACRATLDGPWVERRLPPQPSTSATIFPFAHDPSGALIAAGNAVLGADPELGGVLRHDGTSWATIGPGIPPRIFSVALASSGDVWASGQFGDPELLLTENVRRFSGDVWTTVGHGVSDVVITMAAIDGGEVVLGGRFDRAFADDGTAVSAPGVVRSDGASWLPFDHPSNPGLGLSTVDDLALGPSCEVVASGGFLAVPGVSSPHIATLTTAGAWARTASADVLDFEAEQTTVGPDGTVYAAIYSPWEPEGGGLARLRDGTWERIGEFPQRSIRAIVFGPDGTMFVGGSFDDGLRAWDGDTWTTVGPREPLFVSAMLMHDDALWITESTTTDSRLARWEDGEWTTVATGLASAPSVLAWWMGTIVAGGDEVLAHDSLVVRLRETWWETMSLSTSGRAHLTALAAIDRTIVVVGSIEGRSPLAQWSDDGASWHVLGPFDGPLSDVVVMEGSLLFAGSFHSVAGVASLGLARLDAP